jgi:hypothetical protein
MHTGLYKITYQQNHLGYFPVSEAFPQTSFKLCYWFCQVFVFISRLINLSTVYHWPIIVVDE